MLTTKDNPYDPNTQYDLWLDWDQSHGYFTQEYLSRMVEIPEDASDLESERIINETMVEIVEQDVLGIYEIR